VLSPEEVGRLLEATPGPGLKYKAALSVAYGAGLRAGEVVMLRVSDIDSKRMPIRVEQGKGQWLPVDNCVGRDILRQMYPRTPQPDQATGGRQRRDRSRRCPASRRSQSSPH
jgi:integrase